MCAFGVWVQSRGQDYVFGIRQFSYKVRFLIIDFGDNIGFYFLGLT